MPAMRVPPPPAVAARLPAAIAPGMAGEQDAAGSRAASCWHRPCTASTSLGGPLHALSPAMLVCVGAEALLWTTPAAAGQQQMAMADEEDYGSYDQLTKSAVYRLLKELLPTSASFPSVCYLLMIVGAQFATGSMRAGRAMPRRAMPCHAMWHRPAIHAMPCQCHVPPCHALSCLTWAAHKPASPTPALIAQGNLHPGPAAAEGALLPAGSGGPLRAPAGGPHAAGCRAAEGWQGCTGGAAG